MKLYEPKEDIKAELKQLYYEKPSVSVSLKIFYYTWSGYSVTKTNRFSDKHWPCTEKTVNVHWFIKTLLSWKYLKYSGVFLNMPSSIIALFNLNQQQLSFCRHAWITHYQIFSYRDSKLINVWTNSYDIKTIELFW